jgi:hypothetical protein
VRASLILSAVRGLTRPDAPVITPPRYPLPRRGADAVKECARFTSSSSSAVSLHRRWRPRRSAPPAIARAITHARTAARPRRKRPRAQPPTRAVLAARVRKSSSRIQYPRLSVIPSTLERSVYQFVRRCFSISLPCLPPLTLVQFRCPALRGAQAGAGEVGIGICIGTGRAYGRRRTRGEERSASYPSAAPSAREELVKTSFIEP